MSDLSDFQKRFLLGQGAGQKLFTETEFKDAVAQAKAEVMAIAIETSKMAVQIERDACADIIKASPDISEEIRDKLVKEISERLEKLKNANKVE